MKECVYQIFQQCFPSIPIHFAAFQRKLNFDDCACKTVQEKGKTVGFSLVQQNGILLLCVLPEYQGRGYGTQLLQKSEELIHAQGFERVTLGSGPSGYLFQGVPVLESRAECFFERFGYEADGTSVDMAMPLAHFSLQSLEIPSCPEGVSCRLIHSEEREKLLAAVLDAQPDWRTYFETIDPHMVLIAEQQGEIAGFCIVDENGAPLYDDTTGEIGCVGVVRAARKKGIGLVMAAHATEELKKRGCKNAFLSFTELEHWYSQIGYRTTMRFWMGEKLL
ncbi:MAG: GNAT family N-acetyltransferase [Oscillospiraceae bacterium]